MDVAFSLPLTLTPTTPITTRTHQHATTTHAWYNSCTWCNDSTKKGTRDVSDDISWAKGMFFLKTIISFYFTNIFRYYLQ